jgi:hypothetical protein
MSRLLNSSSPRLRAAFEQWSDTPLKELGFAITTRMHMLGLCIRRLNTQVSKLRDEVASDPIQREDSLSAGTAFALKDQQLPYELLLDMDSFLFETRSLYEIMGSFLAELFRTLFDRNLMESDVKSILEAADIDTRWVDELRRNRILFFHKTAPWIAVRVEGEDTNCDPVLLKRQVITFDDPDTFVEFAGLREIYDGFINSITELHRFILEQIRLHEQESGEDSCT